MAVRIRLKRMGAKKKPFYRLVVADARTARDGAYIDAIGSYDPLAHPEKVQVDSEKARLWLQRGAQPSDAARRLLAEAGLFDEPKAESGSGG